MRARDDVFLDVSRLLRAAWRSTPSGIERVEFAYARAHASIGGARFVARLFGQIHCLPPGRASAFLESLETSWTCGGRSNLVAVRWHALAIIAASFARTGTVLFDRRPEKASHAIYMNMSHENLVSPGAIRRFKARAGARMLCFVHDLIPILYPEFVKPCQSKRHRRRMAVVASCADAVIVNSNATRLALLDHFGDVQHAPAVYAVPLGVGIGAGISGPPAGADETAPPYFVCVATIEPRKNHLLLLHIWRGLAGGVLPAPKLILVGRRGWENEMILDILERGSAISGIVEERRGVSDEDLAALLKHARALLLPSFAEGFGLPVAEALAAGTPVICSDLPALREVGGGVPEYLDPLDGLGWRQAILDYAQPASARRAAQCQRMLAWQAPRWETHFRQVADIMRALAAKP